MELALRLHLQSRAIPSQSVRRIRKLRAAPRNLLSANGEEAALKAAVVQPPRRGLAHRISRRRRHHQSRSNAIWMLMRSKTPLVVRQAALRRKKSAICPRDRYSAADGGLATSVDRIAGVTFSVCRDVAENNGRGASRRQKYTGFFVCGGADVPRRAPRRTKEAWTLQRRSIASAIASLCARNRPIAGVCQLKSCR